MRNKIIFIAFLVILASSFAFAQQSKKPLNAIELSQIETISELLEARKIQDSMDDVRWLEALKKLMNQAGGRYYFAQPGYVILEQDTIFTFESSLGNQSPGKRAKVTTEVLAHIQQSDDGFEKDSLALYMRDSLFIISYKGLTLMEISPTDALIAGEHNPKELGENFISDLFQYFEQEEKTKLERLYGIIKQTGLALLVIGSTILIVYFLNIYFSRAEFYIIRSQKQYFKGFAIGNYEVLSSDRQLYFFSKFIFGLRWFIYLTIFYFSLPLLFSVFPFTRGWAETLLAWIIDPIQSILSSLWGFLPNLFTIAVIFIITRFLVRFIKFLAHEVDLGKLKVARFHADWAIPTYNIIKILVYAFMFVVIFPYLPGSDSEIFRGVSVFLGILFSLGSSSAIANAVAGLVITYMRPFKVGDRVTIGQVSGLVKDKSLLVTRIRTTKNEDITVPNASILSGHTINYSSSRDQEGLILHTTVTIGYEVPWRKVHHLLIEAAAATEGINVSKEPFVLQTSLDDFYVSYQLNAFTDMPESMPRIYSDLHANIQDYFNKQGVEIMSPHYRANRDGGVSTIPVEA